eukprot:GDKJ01007787.1.p1 GENE.GDKJ01007787.1~~GDKJ01007787.1.p1  ORF type:complete len:133 (-),score=15.52 GDKJ01007787.1:65-463(-)
MRDNFSKHVVAVSSQDNAHPASNIIDDDDSTFWISTGMYPQDIVIEMSVPSKIRLLSIKHTGIRTISVHGADEIPRFKDLSKTVTFLKRNMTELQHDRVELDMNSATRVRFIKISILNAWDSFVTVHGVSFE